MEYGVSCTYFLHDCSGTTKILMKWGFGDQIEKNNADSPHEEPFTSCTGYRAALCSHVFSQLDA